MNETDERLTEKDEQCSVLEQQVTVSWVACIHLTSIIDCHYSVMPLIVRIVSLWHFELHTQIKYCNCPIDVWGYTHTFFSVGFDLASIPAWLLYCIPEFYLHPILVANVSFVSAFFTVVHRSFLETLKACLHALVPFEISDPGWRPP